MKNDYSNPATGRRDLVSAKTPLQLILLALLCAGLLLGCAQIRKATYPSDFVYLEQKQIKTQMALFSLYLRQLDQILLDDSIVSSEQQQQIIGILSKIEASTTTLGAGNIRTNHLVIDDHIDQFRNDVYSAINNASADPPNYFALGRLSGSCVGCHKFR
jgi:hypothetical protein